MFDLVGLVIRMMLWGFVIYVCIFCKWFGSILSWFRCNFLCFFGNRCMIIDLLCIFGKVEICMLSFVLLIWMFMCLFCGNCCFVMLMVEISLICEMIVVNCLWGRFSWLCRMLLMWKWIWKLNFWGLM